MALKTSLTFLSKKISEAVGMAARNQGLAPHTYSISGSYNKDADHISLMFNTTEPIDELQLYKEFFEEVRRLFPNDPFIAMHLGLVIRQVLSDDELDSYAYWSETQEDITYLLNRL